MDDIGGVWRTIGGRRIFIKDGQDLKTAMKESGKFINRNLYVNSNGNFKKSTQDIIDGAKQMVSSTLAKRTKGIKVERIQKKYSYFNQKENKIYLGVNADEYSLIHEVGHKLQSVLTKDELNEYNKIIKVKFKKYTKKDFKKVNRKTGTYWLLKNCDEFVSEYQTRVYDYIFPFIFDKANTKCALEYLSEGLMYYYKNPSLLKSKDLELYKFIEKVIK